MFCCVYGKTFFNYYKLFQHITHSRENNFCILLLIPLQMFINLFVFGVCVCVFTIMNPAYYLLGLEHMISAYQPFNIFILLTIPVDTHPNNCL